MALEGDKELYEELLQPLAVKVSQCHRLNPSQFVDLDDDNDALPQHGAVNLCE